MFVTSIGENKMTIETYDQKRDNGKFNVPVAAPIRI